MSWNTGESTNNNMLFANRNNMKRTGAVGPYGLLDSIMSNSEAHNNTSQHQLASSSVLTNHDSSLDRTSHQQSSSQHQPQQSSSSSMFSLSNHQWPTHHLSINSNSIPSTSGSSISNSRNVPTTSFDPSDFPTLGHLSSNNGSFHSRSNYVGMLKQPQMECNEFTMSHEDFPALPGAVASNCNQISGGTTNGDCFPTSQKSMNASTFSERMILATLNQHQPDRSKSSSANYHEVESSSSAVASSQMNSYSSSGVKESTTIQTTSDGTLKNIPKSMVTDQFGMIGLLSFIRAAATDINLVSLHLGSDLTTLGLNLNSDSNLYPTFAGPWHDSPCRPQDIDCPFVPQEYLTNDAIREKLSPVKLSLYKDDVLFFLFYTNIGDVLQMASAIELYNRDWRFHKEERVWICRPAGVSPSQKTPTYEHGTYFYFDVVSWRKTPKDFFLEYDKLEDRPSFPMDVNTSLFQDLLGGSTQQTQQQQQAAQSSPTTIQQQNHFHSSS